MKSFLTSHYLNRKRSLLILSLLLGYIYLCPGCIYLNTFSHCGFNVLIWLLCISYKYIFDLALEYKLLVSRPKLVLIFVQYFYVISFLLNTF